MRVNQTLDRGECRTCRSRRETRQACTVCGQLRRVNARTPTGGAVCGTCYAHTRTGTDVCDGCHTVGPLQARAGGRSGSPTNLCVRCYRHPRRPCGVCGRTRRVALAATATTPDICPTCYQAPVIDCSICGQPGLGRRTTNNGRPRCFVCQARQQVDAALTGPDGLIRPELVPVRDALVTTDRPRSLLSNRHDHASLALLADIAQGDIDLTHDALDARAQTFSVTYLRAMLVAAGALPPRDEHAARLHRYATAAVVDIDDPEHRSVLVRYARWHVVARATVDRHGHITPAVAGHCRADIQTAKDFLDRLATHGHNLHDCPQHAIDTWLATDHNRRLRILRWLKRNGYLTAATLPTYAPPDDPGHDIDPTEQLDLARRLLHDPDAANVEDRAAACLILLYAQPATRIVALTTHDLHTDGDDAYLRLGPEPLLLIPPLDGLLAALPVAKPFGTAATLADRRWLFTGKNAGTHLHPTSLTRRMHRLGIATRANRNTALLHLASTTPPAIFASLIGVHINTATRWTRLAGAAYNTYAAAPR